jgi:hypothetical protein
MSSYLNFGVFFKPSGYTVSEFGASFCTPENRILDGRTGELFDIVTTDVFHNTARYANNRVEQSHEPTRLRERGMRRFKSPMQAQRFLSAHAAVYKLFNLGRHLVRAEHYRNLRISAFKAWTAAAA